MHKLLLNFGILLLSSGVASWLRMFDPALAMQSWPGLIGRPFKFWIAAFIFYPVFELLYSWPAYILGGSFYFALTRRWNKITWVGATLCGVIIGFSIYLLYASLTGEWIMRPTSRILEELFIYTIAGAFYGWANYYVTVRQKQIIQ
jgi:hypothetical protein